MKQITSLRGLAIILIILFHLTPEHFPYGYFGVEVFLVISGYLLMKSFQKQQMQIHLREFARKKVLRLFAPVAVFVPLTLLSGMFFLDYTDLATASSTGGYTLIGAANRFLAIVRSNYFAQDSSGNPFLHMWYLAVTAQVYILFAAGCVLYRYLPKRAAAPFFWIVGIGSFLWAYSYPLHNLLQEIGVPVWYQVRPPSHYMTLPRLWEVCAGILLASYPPLSSTRCANSLKNSLLFLLGVLCILVPAFSHGKDVSLCSAIVVLGTCLVIRYAEYSKLHQYFSNKFLLWVGGISFSLYLVHMPLIAFYHSWFLQTPDCAGMFLIILLSLGIGYLFYIAVESRKIGWLIFIPSYAIALALCVIGRETQGFKNYINADINKIQLIPAPTHEAVVVKDPKIYQGFDKESFPFSPGILVEARNVNEIEHSKYILLHIGNSSKPPSFVLIGDSHAAASFYGMDVVCKKLGLSGIYVSSILFPFWDWELPDESGTHSYYCDRKKLTALLTWLKFHPEIKHVVIAQRWDWRYNMENRLNWDLKPIPNTEEVFLHSLREFMSRIQSMGKDVTVLGPILFIKSKNVAKFIRLSTRRSGLKGNWDLISCSRQKYLSDYEKIIPCLRQLEKEGYCHVLDLLDYIPEDKPFCAYEKGIILYGDDHHMTRDGSIRLFQFLEQKLKRLDGSGDGHLLTPGERKTTGRERSALHE